MRRAAPALGLGLVLVAACDGERDGEPEREAASRGDATVGGRVVATVDGEPITVERVRELARQTGLPPREAARRLEERVLLAREARRRGYADDPRVAYVRKQTAVQALLAREVEDAITAESIGDERVREVYEARGEEHWSRPAKRASVHVLAKMGPDADAEQDARGRRFAARVLHELAFADDPEAVLDRYRGTRQKTFEVIAEELPPKARDAELAQEYLDALFEVDRPGVVDAPVRTRFGWHAIRVTRIEPAREGTFEEVAEQIRNKLVAQRRKDRLVELVRELRRRIPIERRRDAIAAAVRSDLAGGSR